MFTTSTRTVGTCTRLAAVAAMVAVLGPVSLASGSALAYEPEPSITQATVTPWYAIPVATLGGLTLNQYVSRHEERVLGLIGV